MMPKYTTNKAEFQTKEGWSIKKNLNKKKIDSTRVFFPSRYAKFKDKEFGKRLAKMDTKTYDLITEWDDEGKEFVVKSHVQTTKYNPVNGVGASYSLRKIITHKPDSMFKHQGGGPVLSQNEEYIFIGFSAKLLKERYWEGINRDNIKLVYDFIIEEGAIDVSFEDFLNARVADTDFAIDKYILSDIKDVEMAKSMDCQNIVRHLDSATRAGVYKKLGKCAMYCTKKNTGKEFGSRKSVGKAYKTRQFLKFYAKLLELLYNEATKLFTKTYLNHEEIMSFDKKFFMRVETTLKDKRHFESYGVMGIDTLKDLLALDLEEVGEQFFERPIKKYMYGGKFQTVPSKKLTPSQLYRLGSLKLFCMLREGVPEEGITREIMEPNIWPLLGQILPEDMDHRNKHREFRLLEKLVKGFTNQVPPKLYNKKNEGCKQLGFLIDGISDQ